MKGIMFFLPFLFAVITSCTKESTPVTNNDPVPSTVNKTVLLQLVNDARKKGCNCGYTYYAPAPALTWNDQLEKAAYNHSTDMYQKNISAILVPMVRAVVNASVLLATVGNIMAKTLPLDILPKKRWWQVG